MAQHLSFFVYGTLRRGQRRQAMWPCEPLDVELATTQGQLFDLGPYPGLATGTDVVLGELWHVRAEDFAQTVQRLDQIEGFHQGGPDYYQRRVVPCHTLDGRNTWHCNLPVVAYQQMTKDDQPRRKTARAAGKDA